MRGGQDTGRQSTTLRQVHMEAGDLVKYLRQGFSYSGPQSPSAPEIATLVIDTFAPLHEVVRGLR